MWGRRALAAVVLALAASTGCSDPAPPAAGKSGTPLLLVAVDGLEWDVLLPLIRRGELPVFRRLMEQGTYGRLRSMQPTLSPVIWTSLATGKLPTEHGIRGFTRRDKGGGQTLYTNHDRTAAAFWNLLTDAGRRVHVVGWWMTFPVEPIDGVMVAQTNTPGQTDAAARRAGEVIIKGSVLPGVPGQVHPHEMEARVMGLVDRVDASMPERLASIFGAARDEMTLLERKLWDASLWSFRADAIYLELGRELLGDEDDFDLLALYVGGTDIVGHRYWRYREPERYVHAPSPGEIERWGSVIDDYYRYLDREIGELIELLPEDGAVLIVSDHGMHASNPGAAFLPDDPPPRIASGHHEDATPGVLLAWGGPFRSTGGSIAARSASDLAEVGGIPDVLPTLLAFFGLPVGSDLEGRVITGLFRPGVAIERGPPAEFGPWVERRVPVSLPDGVEEQRLEQLRSLGYVE